jgi:thioredoxin 1
MKDLSIITLLAFTFLLGGCDKKSEQNSTFSAKDFAEKIQNTYNATIIDVRTPEEFENGHLINAQNIDWNGDDFSAKVNAFDKTKPVFVYCLSGGRSASAANQMRSEGFKEVYELDGGIMAWRNDNLPESNSNKATSFALTDKAFQDTLNTHKVVLVDVYADWCGPCKKMKPFIDEITKEQAGKVTVIRIDADQNPELCQNLNIEALPTLLLYKNKSLVWSNVGFMDKAGISKALSNK